MSPSEPKGASRPTSCRRFRGCATAVTKSRWCTHRRSEAANPLRSSAHVALGVEERGIDAVVGELQRWRPDVCFSHNMGPLEVDRHLLARWPVVKMLHGYFGTCVSGLKMHAFPSACVCRRTFGPACLALYFPRRCGQLSAGAMLKGYRWASEQRELFSRYAATVVASRYMRDEMARHGAPDDRLRVLPLFSTVSSDATAGRGESDTVLFAGRMTPLKGGHVLISAAAHAARLLGRPVRLIMAGDGPQKEAWRNLALSLSVPLELTGWVASEDRAQVYSRGLVVGRSEPVARALRVGGPRRRIARPTCRRVRRRRNQGMVDRWAQWAARRAHGG